MRRCEIYSIRERKERLALLINLLVFHGSFPRAGACAQFVVAYAALEARGARFWHDLASLSLDPVASAGVPWEYLWRGVLAGSDAELGDDCAGNRTVRERS